MSKQVPNPPHPGKYVLEELVERRWTNKYLAKLTGMSQTEVSQLINCGNNINAKRAIALGEAFGTGPEYWMNLQTVHDLWRAGYRSKL